jgi:2-iminobutanoate/2-iminopropanoate deaminase
MHERARAVSTEQAPAAIGPYSQAMAWGDLIFASGQLALDPSSGELHGETAAEQTEKVMENLAAVLQAGGGSLQTILKTTIFLTDLSEFAAVNTAYERALGGHRPARATVEVRGLPKGALVEIEAVAVREG